MKKEIDPITVRLKRIDLERHANTQELKAIRVGQDKISKKKTMSNELQVANEKCILDMPRHRLLLGLVLLMDTQRRWTIPTNTELQ